MLSVQTKMEQLRSLAERTLLFRILFLSFLPVALYIDSVTHKPMSAFYIILMIFAGFSFRHIGFLIMLSGMVTFFRFYLESTVVLEWDTFVYQWISFFFISFSIKTLQQKYMNQKTNVVQLTTVLAKALDSRDPYTANHSENVARYSKMIAEEMGIPSTQLEDLYYGGLLHDIGKIGISESVLT